LNLVMAMQWQSMLHLKGRLIELRRITYSG
jgi:hypothetical protein